MHSSRPQPGAAARPLFPGEINALQRSALPTAHPRGAWGVAVDVSDAACLFRLAQAGSGEPTWCTASEHRTAILACLEAYWSGAPAVVRRRKGKRTGPKQKRAGPVADADLSAEQRALADAVRAHGFLANWWRKMPNRLYLDARAETAGKVWLEFEGDGRALQGCALHVRLFPADPVEEDRLRRWAIRAFAEAIYQGEGSDAYVALTEELRAAGIPLAD